jgi:hypothetical protein
MSVIFDALDAWLTEKPRRKTRLRYSSDLFPSACHRRIWFELHGQEGAARALPTLLRFEAGRRIEHMLVSALESRGRIAGTQVELTPTRPSAWCWAPMHVDAVLREKTLLEVKSTRAEAFLRATGRDGVLDPMKLVRESHLWQVSAYLHEARAQSLADRALLIFFDRDASHMPVELPVSEENGLLVPLARIVREEERKAYLLDAPSPPAALPRDVRVRVWKRKEPPEVKGKLNWQCRNDCPFRASCELGPDEIELDLPLHAHYVETARLAAETHWQAGARTSPLTMTFKSVDAPGKVPEAPTPSLEESQEEYP